MPDKLQREIDEILGQLEFAPKRSWWARLRHRLAETLQPFQSRLASLRVPAVSIGQLLLLSIVVIIIGYVFLSSSSALGRILIIGGFGGFVLAFILSLRRHSRPPQKYWRDRPMELHSQGMGTRLRSWWERWRSRR